MSGLITNGKFWTTDCIRHPKRRLCVCCPNGSHIDVNFDMFYKTLTQMQRSEEMTPKQYKHFRRKQDPTIDSLLGCHTKSESTSITIDEIVYKSRELPAKASQDVQESLEQALHDFEETLIRSSTTDVRSPLVSPLLTNQFSSSLSLKSDTKSDRFYSSINGDRYGSLEPIRTPPEMFRTSTESIRTESTKTSSSESRKFPIFDFSDSPSRKEESPSQTEVKDVGINCSVLTRDVGTMYPTILQRSIATNTNRVRMTNVGTWTESQENASANSLNLSQIYNSPSQRVATVGTQTYTKVNSLQIIERRDQGIQTDAESSLSEFRWRSMYEERPYKHSAATTTDMFRYGSELQPIIENRRLYSKYSQTKDVIVRDRVLCRKVGSQTDRVVTPKFKDIAVNTTRKKLTDTASGESKTIQIQDWCEKCRNSKPSTPSNAGGQSVSKIPRPKSAQTDPNSNKKKLLMRQDTYVTIPSAELEKLKELQKRDSRDQNPDQETNVVSMASAFNNTSVKKSNDIHSSEPYPSESFFQPITDPKIRSEPSKEMKAAMKVLNDSLKKPSFPTLRETTLRNAIGVVQQEWFKVSSLSSANPSVVEDYIDAFEEVSTHLLDFIVNLKDGAGNTCLHYAISHGNFDIVSILIDSKVCNVNVINDAGYTCIMLVSLAQIKSPTHCDVIKRLFSMADVNMKAKQHGQTSLMLASSHGRLDVVKLLLESGADVNIQDDDGSTALMCAAEHGYLDIVNLLATHSDTDLTIKDNDGCNALTIAMEAGHREIGIALYARQHFSDLNHPTASKEKRSRSANPILMEHRRTSSMRSSTSPPSPSAVM